MKKILILTLSLMFSLSFSQGKLYINNYSGYDLTMRLAANSPTGCNPSAIASLTYPANTQDSIVNFNNSLPYIDQWSVRLSYTGNAMTQPVPSGLLTTISPLTRWSFAWFQTRYAGTNNQTPDIDFQMGDPTAFPNCGISGSTFVDGSLSDAFWFYIPSENATYLVVQ